MLQIPSSLALADVASVTIDGESLVRTAGAPAIRRPDAGQRAAASGEASTGSDDDPAAEFRQWATEIVRTRLAKFIGP